LRGTAGWDKLDIPPAAPNHSSDMTAFEDLKRKIENREAVCGVLGIGYVGLPLAVEMARAGFKVIGFEKNSEVVNAVNSGKSHIRDVTQDELREQVESGKLEATLDSERLGECDVISICVPTPLNKIKDPDMSYVMAATNMVAARLRPGQLIVLESTTYPGTTRDLMMPALTAGGLEVGVDIFLCFSPERVDPGNPVWHTRNTPKVLGGITPRCLEAGMAVYETFIEQMVPVSSPEVAELTKILENTFRMINIALANEIQVVCDKLGLNAWEVIEAADTKPFGFMKFTPGPGLGGHCIPLDPHYLAWKMRTLEYKTRLIDLASEINTEMPEFWVNKLQEKLNDAGKPVRDAKVLILGVAYKKDSNDLRESPALEIMKLLARKGAAVLHHDTHCPEIAKNKDTPAMSSVELTDKTLGEADAVMIVTNHSEVDYELVRRRAAIIIDTRNVLGGRKAADE
jgi:UDP-N-acetyl-D-glucosamine dehydrogenase